MKKPNFKKRFKKEWKNILFNLIFVTISVLIVIYFYKNVMLTTILESIVGIIGLLKWKSKRTLAIFIFAGIFGATTEMIVISASGAWNYALPTVLGLIPAWLFILWANAGASLYEVSKEMHNLGVNK